MKDGPVAYAYAKDKNAVYFEGVLIENADPITFVAVSEKSGAWQHPYGKDTHNVYFKNMSIKGADPKTFEVLWWYIYEGCGADRYAKDSQHVFYEDSPVVGADPVSFKALDSRYGKDKNGFWSKQFFRPDITKDPECNYG